MKRYEMMPEEMSFSVGKRVKDVLKQKHLTVSWLAEQVPCDRSNIYNIFRKNDISTALLRRFCEVLEYNFFKELSDTVEVGINKNLLQQGGVKKSEKQSVKMPTFRLADEVLIFFIVGSFQYLT